MIHPTAVVHPGAELEATVEIGPYSIIGARVQIGARTRALSHVVIEGPTTIGADCLIYQFASIGAPPQDKKYAGEPSTLILGSGNVIREHVTLHRGTAHGTMSTVIGDGNLFMASSHVAHDCRVGNENVFANGATLGGHVEVQDRVILGGLVGVHQFTRIGSFAMLAGGAMASQDVPPFCVAQGDRSVLRGINTIGLSRAGYSPEEIGAVKSAFRELFLRGGRLEERMARLERSGQPLVAQLAAFVRGSSRGICRARGE